MTVVLPAYSHDGNAVLRRSLLDANEHNLSCPAFKIHAEVIDTPTQGEIEHADYGQSLMLSIYSTSMLIMEDPGYGGARSYISKPRHRDCLPVGGGVSWRRHTGIQNCDEKKADWLPTARCCNRHLLNAGQTLGPML